MSVAGRRWLIFGLSVVTVALVVAAVLQPGKQPRAYDPDTAHRYDQTIALSGTGGVVLDAGFFAGDTRVGRVVTVPAVEIVDLETGERERQILWPNAHGHAHLGEVVAAQISPDGTRVVTASRDHKVRIWRIESGELLTRFSSSGTVAVAFSPDGRHILTGHNDGEVWAWRNNGVALKPFRGLEESVTSLTFSPDGKRVLAGSEDGSAIVWNWDDATLIARLDAHIHPDSRNRGDRAVSALAISPDGRRVLTGSADGIARLWNADTGALISQRIVVEDTRLSTIAFHVDDEIGLVGFAGSDDGNAKTWRIDNGRPMVSMPAHEYGPWSNWMGSSVHRQLLIAHQRGYISVFHSSRPALPEIEPSSTGPFLDARFLGQSLRAAWVSFVPAVEFADIETGRREHVLLWKSEPGQIEYLEAVRMARISPDGGLVATGAENGLVRTWDTQTGEEMSHHYEGMNMGLTSLAFSPDGTLIVAGYRDNTARVGRADYRGYGHLMDLTGHTGAVNSVAFSPNGDLVATGSSDSTVRLWSAATGATVAELSPPAISGLGAVETVVFSRTGDRIAAIFDNGAVQVWHAGTFSPVATMEADQGRGPTLVVGSQGPHIKVPQSDGKARIWNLDACSESLCRPARVITLAEGGRPEHTAVSLDGRQAASGRDRGQIRLWSHDTHEVLGVIERPRGAVRSMVFDTLGNRLLISAGDSTVRVWDVAEAAGS